MQDIETARAFWAALGQVAGVFAIPLVLEARRSVARWRKATVRVRRVQAVFYALAGLATFDVVTASLFTLIDPRLDPTSMVVRSVEISIVAAGLVLNPVLALLFQANRDLLIVLERALPWSTFRKLRRAVRSAEASVARLRATTIAGLKTMDRFEAELLALRRHDASRSDTLEKMISEIAALTSHGLQKVLPEGVTPDEVNGLLREGLAIAAEDPKLKADIGRQLRAVRAERKKLAAQLDEMNRRAEAFNAVGPYLRIRYLDPELRRALESQVANQAADAANELSSPPRFRSEDLSEEGLDEAADSITSVVRGLSANLAPLMAEVISESTKTNA